MARINLREIKFIYFSIFIIIFLALILGGAIFAILYEAKDIPILSILNEEYIRSVLFFSVWQALLSTILTIILAFPIARALHRRSDFFGRSALIKITNLSFILPSIVIVLGLAVVHGKNGWINTLLGIYGYSLNYYLYGIFGILAGHLVFTLPLAIRVFLNALESIPANNWKLASQLGFKSRNIFKIIEMPIILPCATSVAILVFMMCFTSFVIVLALGGGPWKTTIEVAIYQALRFDFDLSRAVTLSLIQFIVCFILMLSISKFIYNPLLVHNTESNFQRPDKKGTASRLVDYFFIFLLISIVIIPLVSVIISGINDRFLFVIYYSQEFWHAFGNSLYIALCSGILSLSLAPGLLFGSFYLKYHLKKEEAASKFAILSNFSMVMSPFIFVTGLFLLLAPILDLFEVAIYLTIFVNAMMALPFVVGILYHSVTSFTMQEMWICENLNIRGWNFFKLICWGRIRKSVGYALALAVAISWGDLNVAALFGNNEFLTLPYLLYQNLSNYRVNDAAVIAFILLIISYLLFWIIEEFVGGEDDIRI